VHVVAVDRAEPGIPFVTSASVWTPVGSARRRSTCSRRHRRTPSAFVRRCRSRSRARGRITKQGSRRVRWAAVESVKALGPTSVVGAYKKQVADRRGKNIGTVAAASRRVEFVFYALRDHHVRALHLRRGSSGMRPQVMRSRVSDGWPRGRAGREELQPGDRVGGVHFGRSPQEEMDFGRDSSRPRTRRARARSACRQGSG
jgi:hypothetical protein